MNLLIFGSCVTRDVFAFFPDNISIIDYFARSSLISLESKPLGIVESGIYLESNFQRKMVLRDCNKTFYNVSKQLIFDYLIIDFIDERFNLLKHEDTYVTRSSEFVNSKLEMKFNFELVKRNDTMLWEKSCCQFIEKVKEFVPEDKIILHEAYWSPVYINNGEIIEFDKPMLKQIVHNNALLRHYYEFFLSQLPKCTKVCSKLNIADSAHKWGLSPFHYHYPYYEDIYQQIIKFR